MCQLSICFFKNIYGGTAFCCTSIEWLIYTVQYTVYSSLTCPLQYSNLSGNVIIKWLYVFLCVFCLKLCVTLLIVMSYADVLSTGCKQRLFQMAGSLRVLTLPISSSSTSRCAHRFQLPHFLNNFHIESHFCITFHIWGCRDISLSVFSPYWVKQQVSMMALVWFCPFSLQQG